MRAYTDDGTEVACEICKHWVLIPPTSFGIVIDGMGLCEELSGQSRIHPIYTAKDFFCGNWEEK